MVAVKSTVSCAVISHICSHVYACAKTLNTDEWRAVMDGNYWMKWKIIEENKSFSWMSWNYIIFQHCLSLNSTKHPPTQHPPSQHPPTQQPPPQNPSTAQLFQYLHIWMFEWRNTTSLNIATWSASHHQCVSSI